jgi:hypothetical protein
MSHTPPTKRQRNQADASATGAALVAADEVMKDDPPDNRQAKKASAKADKRAPAGTCLPPRPGKKHDALLELSPEARHALCIEELLSRLVVQGKRGSGAAAVALRTGEMLEPLAVLQPPTEDALRQELAQVIAAATLRKENIDSIVAHHLDLDAFFLDVLRLDEDLYRRSHELIALTTAFVDSVVQRLKYIFDVPRPSELEPRLTTAVLLPRHSSWPGGHAAQSHAVAKVLAALGSARVPRNLDKLADFIGDNRVIAGLHYPLDTRSGAALGQLLGDLLVALISDEDRALTTVIIDGGNTRQDRTLTVVDRAPLFRRLAQAARDELDAKRPPTQLT